ncbi:MAG: methyl-accepting chemotaxis protein [Elusimicrobiales bacterium]|nr:methyl-accepting chemotaxis protein [Elusimicrobiales bacterium]
MSDTDNKKKKRVQRKIIFVKKRMQFRYIMTMLISAFFAFAITVHEISWAAGQLAVKNPALRDILSDIVSEFHALWPGLAVKALLFIAILLVFAIVSSHQQAGPVYQFEKGIGKIKRGDFTCRVYLRKGDEFTEMQKEFNDMSVNLHKIISQYESFRAYAAGSSDEKVRNRAVKLSDEIKSIIPEMKI